jgi:hypothetical protein
MDNPVHGTVTAPPPPSWGRGSGGEGEQNRPARPLGGRTGQGVGKSVFATTSECPGTSGAP